MTVPNSGYSGLRIPLSHPYAQMHQAGNEVTWWEGLKINALEIAKGLWEQTHPKSATADTQQPSEIAAKTATEN
jgi:hypothetical protein